MADRCEIRGCRADADLIYLGHGICTRHWDEFMREDAPPDALRMALGIAGRGLETEEVKLMSEHDAAPAEAEAPKEETMPKMKSKTTKTRAAKAAVKAAASKKEAKPIERKKREPREKVELRTLALRVTNAEFDLVHKAAGPRNLTGFMKTAVLTAAQKSLAK